MKKRKIKVLHLGGNLRINGISAFIMALNRSLSKEHFQFDVINSASNDGWYKDEIEHLGGHIFSIYSNGAGLRRLINQSIKFVQIAKIYGPFDVFHTHYYSTNGFFIFLARLLRVPLRISHCHNYNPGNLSLPKKIGIIISALLVKRFSNTKIACSRKAGDVFYKEMSYKVVYYGIDYRLYSRTNQNKISILAKYKLSSQIKYLLFVGRFSKQKNLFFLLDVYTEIASNTKDVNLILIGHGKQENKIKEIINQKNLQDRITILPPHSIISELETVVSALLLPSLWEGFPIALIEAQVMGLTCFISTNITSEVNFGNCVFLPLQQELWVTEILHFVNQPRSADVKISEKFSVEYMTNRMKNIYLSGLTGIVLD